MYRLLACAALLLALPLWAAEPIRIGVLSSPLKPWQPLAAELKRQIPERDFVIEMYDHSGLAQAVESRRLDFVLTNPGHYLLMQRRSGLSSPLVTLVNEDDGHPLEVIGGTIICRAERSDINGLQDIRGKTVAYLDHAAMGGYQMQAYELALKGMDLRRDVQWLKVGASHAKAIEAVLSGKADVGFVRAGQIESMARRGKLDASKLRVLNLQDFPDFPFKTSTHLYPEWPFAALPNADSIIARRVTAVLLQLDRNPALLHVMQIQGFTIPADYQPVENMLVKLRLPPFDGAPEISFRDIWDQHVWEIGSVLVAVVIILLLSLRLVVSNRRLALEKIAVLAQSDKLRESEQNLKRLNEALSESEERWRFALEGAGDGVWDWNVTSGKTTFSKRWKNIIGYAEDEFADTFEAWADSLHPEDKQRVMAAIQDYFDGKADEYRVEFRMRCKEGGWKWILARGMVVGRDAAGKPQRMIGTHADITQRKKLEESLTESESRLRTIIQNEPECIKIVDSKGRLTQMNPAGLAMIEAESLDQVAGNPVINVIAPEYRTAFAKMHKRVLAGESMQMEFEVIGLKGGRRWLETHAVPMQDHGETVQLAVTRDISERKNAELALQRSNADLERFAYTVSHDMRQPLRAISGHLQLLQRSLKEKLDEDERENLAFALDGAKRMDSMIVSLLDYSRVGRKTEAMKWMASRTSLDEAMGFLAPLIAETKTEVMLSGDWPQIFASRDELTRLLQNLIGNAIKFCDAQQQALVEVDSSVQNDIWRVSVRDHGVGIDPQQMGRLFQFFSRLQSRARFEGTGMGLALCRRIVEHHGGRIWAESEGEGKGSTFIFELPLGAEPVKS